MTVTNPLNLSCLTITQTTSSSTKNVTAQVTTLAGYNKTQAGSISLTMDGPGSNAIIFKNSNGTEFMRLNSNGYLGIGTQNPLNILDVNGNADFTSMTLSNANCTFSNFGNESISGSLYVNTLYSSNFVGIILPFAGSSVPTGWQLCCGQAVSRTTYSLLYSVIGTAYGAGDGSTTFNLPDLRGRVIAGLDNMGETAANRLTSGGSGITATTLGANGGAETVTLTAAQSGLPAHSHTITDPGHGHNCFTMVMPHQVEVVGLQQVFTPEV